MAVNRSIVALRKEELFRATIFEGLIDDAKQWIENTSTGIFDIDLTGRDAANKDTFLTYALKQNRAEIAIALLNKHLTNKSYSDDDVLFGKNAQGKTALQCAIENRQSVFIIEFLKKIPTYLQQRPLDHSGVNYLLEVDNDANTILHSLVEAVDVPLLECVLSQLPEIIVNKIINKLNKQGLSPLQRALELRFWLAVSTLINVGANMHAVFDQEGKNFSCLLNSHPMEIQYRVFLKLHRNERKKELCKQWQLLNAYRGELIRRSSDSLKSSYFNLAKLYSLHRYMEAYLEFAVQAPITEKLLYKHDVEETEVEHTFIATVKVKTEDTAYEEQDVRVKYGYGEYQLQKNMGSLLFSLGEKPKFHVAKDTLPPLFLARIYKQYPQLIGAPDEPDNLLEELQKLQKEFPTMTVSSSDEIIKQQKEINYQNGLDLIEELEQLSLICARAYA